MRTCRNIVALLSLLTASLGVAQPRIARIQPDALAPGMTIALEILSFENHTGAFGPDGLAPADLRIVLSDPLDSNLVVFGPLVVSWSGRLIQVPVIVPLSAKPKAIEFHVERGIAKSESVRLHIVEPGPLIDINGNGILGDTPLNGKFSPGNTIVVEGVRLESSDPLNGLFRFAVTDNNGDPINAQLHPVTLLSRGAVQIRNTTLSVSADTINGGPGGGGGGAGYVGVGGYGYTGGGSSDTEFVQPATNVGSGTTLPTAAFGGSSSTGVRGGRSDDTDQGGGGGTGNPFGSSGQNGGQNSPSFEGGFGGASAGGENPSGPYGGGGGGFATAGQQGTGQGDNSGKANGGRFLVPMMGGSGGGAGNSFFVGDTLEAGSGGGGGGALTIISFQSLTISSAARIAAIGANGTPGIHEREGGGGGGSGGGILLASRLPFDHQNAAFTTRNGTGAPGGAGFDSSAHGGDGGLGNIRFDAPLAGPCTNCTGETTYGPTLSVPTIPIATKGVKLSGFAGIGNDLTDSVRIYYRTRHTKWTRVDTVRTRSGAVFVWEKTIPAPLDSLLFVSVFVKVNSPQASFAAFEPQWLTGHLASGVIPIKPGSDLVVSPDTLNIGCTKKGTCLEGLVYVENRGEEILTLDSVYIDPPLFTIKSAPASLEGFDPKTITIEYCPQAVQNDVASLFIRANGILYKKTLLIGCGLDKNRHLKLSAGDLDFGKVHVGDSCAKRNVLIESDGEEAITVDLGELIRPPFFVDEPDVSIVQLAPGEKLNVTIRFCPPDSGSFRETFIISERRDSFVVHGIGTRRILFAPDTFWLGERCKGGCIDTSFTVYSVGNEPFTFRVPIVPGSVTLLHPDKEQILEGNEVIRIRLCFDSVGEHFSTILYDHNADIDSSTKQTVLHYRVNGFSITHDPVFDLGASCSGSCDSLEASVTNLSSKFTITSYQLGDTIFTTSLPQPPIVVNDNGVLKFKLLYCPPQSGKHFDTLTAHISQGECDTTIRIPIHAMSANAALNLSRSAIDFAATDSGTCIRDTVFVDNPCETDIVATLPARTGVFTRIAPAGTQATIPGGSSIALIYEFCPADSLEHSLVDTIRYNGSSVSLSLRGKGTITESPDPPYIRFALDHVQDGIVPQAFSWQIAIDSLFRGNDITQIEADLLFDPIVALPLALTANDAWSVTGTESQPGVYHITATRDGVPSPGSFVTVSMQALRSRRDSTGVVLSNMVVAPQGTAAADTGSIRTNACSEPPPNIIIPGPYALGDPTPNPLRNAIVVPLRLGAEGTVTIRLYNAQGALVLSWSDRKHKGAHEIGLNISGFAPGLYVLEAESWGWRDHKNVVIVR